MLVVNGFRLLWTIISDVTDMSVGEEEGARAVEQEGNG